jgi:site-specific recombinase XerD
MNLNQAIEAFGRYQRMRGRAAGTERSYGYLLEQWGRWLAGQQVEWRAVELEQIESFLEEYRERHSRTSTALFGTCLRSFYKWARRRKHVPTSPAAELEPIERDRPQPRALPDQVIRSLLSAMDMLTDQEGQRNRLIVRTFLFTGLRLSELAELGWPDIDVEARTILVRKAKGGRQRIVAINATLYADLLEWGPQVHGPIWICSRGPLTPAGISEMFRKVVQKELGFEGVTAHDLRHTHGTKLRREGADLRAIQAALGHAKTQTTALYTAVYDDELHEAVNLLTCNW